VQARGKGGGGGGRVIPGTKMTSVHVTGCDGLNGLGAAHLT